MKKTFVSLLILGLFLMLPLSALASTAIEINDKSPDNVVSNSDGTETRTYTIYMTTTANEEVSNATISFNYGTAIKQFTCDGAGDFTLDNQNDDNNNKSTCIFKVPNDGKASGQKFAIGKMSIKVDKNARDEDCSVNYSFDGVEGVVKSNPETGASVPYLAIGGAIVLAAGVYFVTNKRAKLYKI